MLRRLPAGGIGDEIPFGTVFILIRYQLGVEIEANKAYFGSIFMI
jgi:hypothetical protein